MIHSGFLVVSAIGLGLAYAAAPGAVNTEAIRRGIARGGLTTLLVETGSLFGDVLWAAVALTGVALLAHAFPVQIVLGIVGGCFLLRMGWLALHEAWLGTTPAPQTQRRGDFATGVFFGLANPVGLAFWSGLGSGVVASGATGASFVLFFLGFFLGAVCWCCGIAALIHWGRRWVRPAVFRWINTECGLILGWFGIAVLWSTLSEIQQHFHWWQWVANPLST